MRRVALVLLAALGGCVQAIEHAPERAARSGVAIGYVVQPGDTLAGVASRLGVDMLALARANGLSSPYVIRVGQRLAIPPRTARYENRPAVPPRRPAAVAMATPRPQPRPVAPAPRPVPATSLRLVWPADGPVAETFGAGADGRGIAIATHQGAAVRSAAAGTVLFAGEEPNRYGRLVLVDHGGGWVSAYGHLGRLTVRQGERLAPGARLGFVGASAAGAPSTPRLHFELRRDNRPIDPLPLLPRRF